MKNCWRMRSPRDETWTSISEMWSIHCCNYECISDPVENGAPANVEDVAHLQISMLNLQNGALLQIV